MAGWVAWCGWLHLQISRTNWPETTHLNRQMNLLTDDLPLALSLKTSFLLHLVEASWFFCWRGQLFSEISDGKTNSSNIGLLASAHLRWMARLVLLIVFRHDVLRNKKRLDCLCCQCWWWNGIKTKQLLGKPQLSKQPTGQSEYIKQKSPAYRSVLPVVHVPAIFWLVWCDFRSAHAKY